MSLLHKVKSCGIGSPDWHASMFDTDPPGCTALEMSESREMTERIDWRETEARNRQKWLASRLGSEVLRSLRHYLQAKIQRLATHTSIAWRREGWKEEAIDDLT